jgi:hypothetical protein
MTMSNPYQPPAADSAALAAPASKAVPEILIGIGLVFAVLAALIPALALPGFQSVYASFGTDTSPLTLFVFKYHAAYWICPLGVAAIGLSGRNRPRRAAIACAAGAAAFLVLLPLSFGAAYWGIWKLGAVV